MRLSHQRLIPRVSAEEIAIGTTLVTQILSHLGSVGVGLYQGYTNSTDSPLTFMYTIPFIGSALSGASANVLLETSERSNLSRPLRQDYDLVRAGARGFIKGGTISGIELGAGYGVGYFVGSLVEKLF